MDVLEEYLDRLSRCGGLSSNQQAVELLALLNLDPQTNPYIVKINSLPFKREKQIHEMIDSKHLYNDDWLAFNEVVFSFIKLSNQLNPWSVLESFDLYTLFLNDVSVAFSNYNRGQVLSYLVKSTINIIIPMAVKLDHQLYYKDNCARPRLAYLASILLKIFNNIRSQLGDTNDNPLKKSIILFVGGKLCSIYFRLSNPLLCRNIFSNMNNANLSFTSFEINEQIRYRYYLARFYMMKDQLVDAYQNFTWCLLRCPFLQNNRNITNILRYLLPISIVIGKRPNFAYLRTTYYTDEPEFFGIYSLLYNYIRVGNIAGYNATVVSNYKYLKQYDLLLLVASKAKVVLLRNLLKNIWKSTGRPLKLEYDTIRHGLQFALGPDRPHLDYLTLLCNVEDDSTIENVLICLIDQNLLRGKIFSRLRAIALSKSNVFARLETINFTRFGHGIEGTMSTSDRWMS
ncbi:uncharacterized protein PRCAT00005307001 [Priceomyces carsonii]|uniref:uncharacterized protein n=1 Tax=Priceomyces carsonii TaxID=28549 RepID=UPI002EDA98E7|nr:unnamed protein product [Priceomyces carsonii]